MRKIVVSFLCVLMLSCNNNNSDQNKQSATFNKGSFGYDIAFLEKYHPDLIILGDNGDAQVLVIPAYQGRVMTSTANGNQGMSFGWINYELISSGKKEQHMNAVGGEERFWLGPEGGQFSIYFKKGDEFVFDNWNVPKEIDTEPFKLLSSSESTAEFEKHMLLENYSGNKFDLDVNRRINLLNANTVDSLLGIVIPKEISCVAFETVNTVTNTGKNSWDKNTGMLSIWILSMLNAADSTTVIIPIKSGDSANLKKIITDDYFGKVPPDRLKVSEGKILFKADGNYRSKIGISPFGALPVAGSFDASNNVLTIAQFNLPVGINEYVNSLWKIQDDPFSGDVINSYNDGPIDGKQMGKFYELESSSPAAALNPGQSIQHIHRTIHLKGSKEELDLVSRKIFGVGIDSIKL